jgi:hypothetical protein
MLYDLLQDPSHYELWFQRYASGLIFRLAYGKIVRTGEESHVQEIIKVNHNFERIASPGVFLVNSLPILKYLPEWLAPFKREGRRLHEVESGLFRALLKAVEAEVEAGTAGPSFARTWLENKNSFPLTEDEASYVFGTLFEAGTGTTAAAMMSSMLVIVLFLSGSRQCGMSLMRLWATGCQSLRMYPDSQRVVQLSRKSSVRGLLPVEVSTFPLALIAVPG